MKHILISVFLCGLAFSVFNCATVDLNGLDPSGYNGEDNSITPGNTSPNNPDPFALIDCNTVDATFSTQIQPIFDTNCATSGCHTGANPGGNIPLDASINGPDTPTSLTQRLINSPAIDNLNAFQSALITEALDPASGGKADSHGGGIHFSDSNDANFKKLYCWVMGGLENDLDNSDFNFGDDIYPILDLRCSSCHPVNGGLDFRARTNSPRGMIEHLLVNQDPMADNVTPVIPGDAANSPLIINPQQQGTLGIETLAQHPSRPFNPEELQAVENWINNGAPAD